VKFQGFVGPSYTLDSVNVDAQRCVNMYPELIESGSGKEGQQYYLKSTPGLENLLFDLSGAGDEVIRLIHFANPPFDPLAGPLHASISPPTRIFVVAGIRLYRLEYDGATWDVEHLKEDGALEVFRHGNGVSPINAVSTQNGLGETVFVDGSGFLQYLDGSGVPKGNSIYRYKRTKVTDTTYTETVKTVTYSLVDYLDWLATHVALIDGYLIFNKKNTDQFQVSDWNTFNLDPINYASSEGDPDKIMALIACRPNCIDINEKTI